jgi:hypothetical protein
MRLPQAVPLSGIAALSPMDGLGVPGLTDASIRRQHVG